MRPVRTAANTLSASAKSDPQPAAELSNDAAAAHMVLSAGRWSVSQSSMLLYHRRMVYIYVYVMYVCMI